MQEVIRDHMGHKVTKYRVCFLKKGGFAHKPVFGKK